jgi:hypothetical protein
MGCTRSGHSSRCRGPLAGCTSCVCSCKYVTSGSKKEHCLTWKGCSPVHTTPPVCCFLPPDLATGDVGEAACEVPAAVVQQAGAAEAGAVQLAVVLTCRPWGSTCVVVAQRESKCCMLDSCLQPNQRHASYRTLRKAGCSPRSRRTSHQSRRTGLGPMPACAKQQEASERGVPYVVPIRFLASSAVVFLP